MPKTIAVLLDDVLNYFSEALQASGILFDGQIHTLADPLLCQCLYQYPTGELLPPARHAMAETALREDAPTFMQWLQNEGWKILLCTGRDLRFAYAATAKWLQLAQIPYSVLVQTYMPVELCLQMGIPYLVSNGPAVSYDRIQVFSCPALHTAHGFEEVKQCLTN